MLNLEILEKKKGLIVKIVIPVAVVILVSYGFGVNGAKTELNGEKLNYEEIAKEVKSAKEDLKTFEEKVKETELKINSVKDDYAKRKNEFDTALRISGQKDILLVEANKLSGDINSKKSEIETLNATIQTKKDEVASIEQVLIEKKEAPVQLPAGTFIVGKDIQSGRYKVLPVGRGSNFFVRDSNGANLYSAIVSNTPDHGVPEYIVFLSEGYIIEARSPFKYVPIE